MPGTNAPLLVIGDTDGLIALLHEDDALFAQAKQTVEYLVQQDARIVFPVTTTLAVFFTGLPLVPVMVAVIVALPADTPVASPVVLTTVATAEFEEVQVDTALMFP